MDRVVHIFRLSKRRPEAWCRSTIESCTFTAWLHQRAPRVTVLNGAKEPSMFHACMRDGECRGGPQDACGMELRYVFIHAWYFVL